MATNAIVKVDEQQLQAGLVSLREVATTLVVQDKDTCLQAKTAQRDVRAYMKDVHAKLDPFVEAAKMNLSKARDEVNRWINPAEQIDATLAQKVKDYETQERLAAEAEQRRINEERRKKAQEEADRARDLANAQAELARKKAAAEAEAARKAGEIGKREAEKLKKEAAEAAEKAKVEAEQNAKASVAAVKDVVVKPDIPTVAGVPSRRNWRFKIVDAAKIPRAFLIPDEQQIGALVRATKDKEKIEALIPGIEAYLE